MQRRTIHKKRKYFVQTASQLLTDSAKPAVGTWLKSFDHLITFHQLKWQKDSFKNHTGQAIDSTNGH